MLWCLFERLHVTKNKKLCFRRTPWVFFISVSYVTFMIRYWLPNDILFTSDTCRMSCHTSCHTHVTRLVTRFCLLTSATYRMSCHAVVLQVIYLKSYRFKRAFFTLRYFFKLFPGASISNGMSAGLHAVVQNNSQAWLFVWMTQQSTNLMFRGIFIQTLQIWL